MSRLFTILVSFTLFACSEKEPPKQQKVHNEWTDMGVVAPDTDIFSGATPLADAAEGMYYSYSSEDSTVNVDSINQAVNSLIEKVSPFVSEEYICREVHPCDLNQDKLEDYIVILYQKNEGELEFATQDNSARPILVLFGKENQTLELAERCDSAVYCKHCGGVFGDPYNRVVSKRNYFSIEHYGGSNWRWEKIITFKYDSEKEGIYLHKVGSIGYNLEGEVDNETVLSTKDLGVIKLEDFNIYKY